MTTSLSFYGAAGTVTGSCYALTRGDDIVLVDCGLFQGTKSVRELNYGPLPFDLSRVRGVLLTHAHIDHCGLLPKLAANGWRGPVFCTAATVDLLGFMLPDTAHIQEFEVARLNRRNRRRGRPPVDPIYTHADAEKTLADLRPIALGQSFAVTDWLQARFWNAGHILGSASIEIELSATAKQRVQRVLFSGDLGPEDKAFHDPAQAPTGGIDHLIMECTYGGRSRPALDETQRQEALATTIRAALDRGGPILMPVFAVERTQELLYDLDCLIDRGELPDIPTYLDSPLAIRATQTFDHHLPHINQPGTPHPFRRDSLRCVMQVSDSQQLEQVRSPILIMAGSGMCDAGRIREHIADHLWRPETTLILVGYQAPGTLGRIIAEGAPRIRIHGQQIDIAGTVEQLDAYSGHADANGLLSWAQARGQITGTVFLTHGETVARAAIAEALIDAGYPPDCIAQPILDQRFELRPDRRALATDSSACRLTGDKLNQPRDWHNRYAAVSMALGEALRQADNPQRMELLTQFEEALGIEPPRGSMSKAKSRTSR